MSDDRLASMFDMVRQAMGENNKQQFNKVQVPTDKLHDHLEYFIEGIKREAHELSYAAGYYLGKKTNSNREDVKCELVDVMMFTLFVADTLNISETDLYHKFINTYTRQMRIRGQHNPDDINCTCIKCTAKREASAR